jgi:hypothetical protein
MLRHSVFLGGFRSGVAHCSQVFVKHGMECRRCIDVATTRLTVSTADHVVNPVDAAYLIALTPSTQDRYIGEPGHGSNPDTAERASGRHLRNVGGRGQQQPRTYAVVRGCWTYGEIWAVQLWDEITWCRRLRWYASRSPPGGSRPVVRALRTYGTCGDTPLYSLW